MAFGNRLVGRYRALSSGTIFILAPTLAFVLATVFGFFGGYVAMRLYERYDPTWNVLVVGLGALFAVGTFTFVVSFTWLQQAHHPISSRTPLFALCACLFFPVATTIASIKDNGTDYLQIVLGVWLAILVLALLSLLMCRRWCRNVG